MVVARDAPVVRPLPHPANLPDMYLHYVSELVRILTNDKVVGRAVDELRQLIECITDNYDEDIRSHTLEITGNLVCPSGECALARCLQ